MSVELVFETHATSEDNERGLATGWKPGHLSAAGREQARELGLRRADDGISAIFTSDLSRALETVGIAFGESRIPVLHDWRLRECNYGAMNVSPANELRRRDHFAVPYPSGESWRGAVARVAGFLDDLGSSWFGDRVLVVGHTATWFALEHHLHDAALEDLLDAPFSWQAGWEYRVTLR